MMRVYTRSPDGRFYIAQSDSMTIEEMRAGLLDFYLKEFLAKPTHAILVRVK